MTAARTSSVRSRLAWATFAAATLPSFSKPKSSSRPRSKPKGNFSRPCKASAWARAKNSDPPVTFFMNNDRRVVITGLGVVTPVGNDIETFWSNLKNGVSGIRAIDAFDTAGYDCKIGGQVRDFDPKPFFKNPKDVRRTDRFTQLAMAAAKMAVTDSGIDMENLEQRDRFGVIVSTGIGG